MLPPSSNEPEQCVARGLFFFVFASLAVEGVLNWKGCYILAVLVDGMGVVVCRTAPSTSVTWVNLVGLVVLLSRSGAKRPAIPVLVDAAVAHRMVAFRLRATVKCDEHSLTLEPPTPC